MLDKILIGAGGLLLGVGVGILATKGYFEKKALKEVEEVREYYHSKAKNKNTVAKDAFETLKAQNKEYREVIKGLSYDLEEDTGIVYEDGTMVNPEDIPTTIKNVYGDVIMVTPEEAAFDNEGSLYQARNKSARLPYLISYEEFAEENPGYDKITVTFYQGDNTYADDRDDIIDDTDRKLGKESYKFFGWRSHYENIVYVRNDKLGCDWEISLDLASYRSAVLSMDEW